MAASQLERIRAAGVKLTVCVDKIAASGGYMMAVVADRIVCAPFAVVGSIGVVAGMPNLRRLLHKHDIDFEQVTAGRYKRTLTVFGENTDEARAKFQAELDEIHRLFKELVGRYRPALDMDTISTGEWWLGTRALELGLVDEVGASDDLLVRAAADADVLALRWQQQRGMATVIGGGVAKVIARGVDAWHEASGRSPHV